MKRLSIILFILMGALIGSIFIVGCSSKPPAKKVKEIDREQVRRSIRTHMNEVQKCYEEGLKRDPKLQGKLALSFTINQQGQAVNLNPAEGTTLKDVPVTNCIRTAVAAWKFPIPPGNSVAEITYPFVFKAPPPTAPAH